jgi:ATP-dependent DNA helicase RecQ
LIGRVNAIIKAHRTDSQSFFCGVAFDEKYWMALLRQVLVGYLYKDIETYGIVKITTKEFFINKPSSL